jgi:hypothetical protein
VGSAYPCDDSRDHAKTGKAHSAFPLAVEPNFQSLHVDLSVLLSLAYMSNMR